MDRNEPFLSIEPKSAKRVVTIDIGGRATDLAYIINGKQNQTSSSGSLRLGVLDVHELLSEEIKKEYGLKGDLPPDLLDYALRQKRFSYRGAEQNIDQIVIKCVHSLAQRIKREIVAQLGDTDIADKTILVDGGAVVFEAAIISWRVCSGKPKLVECPRLLEICNGGRAAQKMRAIERG
jgi:hypothetical protein